MSKEILDYIVAGVQVLTLIAVIIYVKKTWDIASATKRSTIATEHMLREMKESRVQEMSPYVVVYFDIPHDSYYIYLVIKNIGKSIAKDVKLIFTPALQNTRESNLGEISILKSPIASIPPGYEIRTIIDIGSSYFRNSNLPLSHKVQVTFGGGLEDKVQKFDYSIDLSVFKDLTFARRKGLPELAESVEKISQTYSDIERQLENILEIIKHGIWLRNPDLDFSFSNPLLVKYNLKSRLVEFNLLWTEVYKKDEEKSLDPFITDLRNRMGIIGQQLLGLSANLPEEFDKEFEKLLIQVSRDMIDLSVFRYYLDGGQSYGKFESKGLEVAETVKKLLIMI